MIVQFFARGKGGGSGPTDYLLGKDRAREDATLLRGDPDETAAIIDGSQYAKKYTSGCLSFEETNISEEKKRELWTVLRSAFLLDWMPTSTTACGLNTVTKAAWSLIL